MFWWIQCYRINVSNYLNIDIIFEVTEVTQIPCCCIWKDFGASTVLGPGFPGLRSMIGSSGTRSEEFLGVEGMGAAVMRRVWCVWCDCTIFVSRLLRRIYEWFVHVHTFCSFACFSNPLCHYIACRHPRNVLQQSSHSGETTNAKYQTSGLCRLRKPWARGRWLLWDGMNIVRICGRNDWDWPSKYALFLILLRSSSHEHANLYKGHSNSLLVL